MNKTFGDELVELWEAHKKRGEQDISWKTSEPMFRHRLSQAAEQMFGDLAPLLEWEVALHFGERLKATAEIPGYTTRLEWSPDITGLYVFRAWTRSPDYGVNSYHIDGRLKLGAILFEEEPDEGPGEAEAQQD